MLAVLLQAGVIQTHNHLASGIVTANDQLVVPAFARAVGTVASDKSRPTAPPVCPLCEERALFGSYVPAAPAIVAAPVVAAAWYALTRIFSSIGRQASHAWRSRAPPIA
jgi:hypothetical protein